MAAEMIASVRTMPPLRDALDDRTLARLARDDAEAFAVLYRRHIGRVYRYLLVRTASTHDAEDLASHTFMQAMQHIGRFRGESEFSTWLIGIARHTHLDHLRRARPTVSLTEVDLPDDIALDDIVAGRMRLSQVIKAMHSLSPDRAEAIALRIFADLSFANVARVMHKSEAAAKMLVGRGLADLRKRLASHES